MRKAEGDDFPGDNYIKECYCLFQISRESLETIYLQEGFPQAEHAQFFNMWNERQLAKDNAWIIRKYRDSSDWPVDIGCSLFK